MKTFKKALVGLGLILASQSVFRPAQAVITDTDVQTVTAVGNGVTTNYTIGFQFQDNDEIRVYLQTESTTPYTRSLVTYGSGAGKYTITGGDPGTTVVMGTAPTSSQRVIIKRVTSLTQSVDYVETDAFPAENHEEQMDRMVQSLQELDSAVGYKIGLSTVSTYATPTMPDPVADKWPIWNHAGTDFALAPTGTMTVGDVPIYTSTGWSTYNATNGVIAGLAAHIADTANPHAVTATQVGKDTAQWNASKIQGKTVDDSSIGNGRVLAYDSGSGTIKYAASALPALGSADTVLNVNSAGTDTEYDLIKNANVDPAAGIADTKLATISTAGKVSNSATTATASNTMSAIMARDSSGQVAASTFTGDLVGNVTGNVTGSLTGNVTGNVSGTSGSTTGNAATATALAANPTDCGAGTKATAIDASGNLTCSAVSVTADISGVVPVANGGTNIASYTAGDILYASGSTTLSKLAAGTATQVLKGGTTPSWGSVAGGDGVQQNLIGLDSNYSANYTTDRDAETSVGNWTAYADAAGTSPVDMTGGSPNTTCTRVGASTMNGAAYFLMTVSSGATRQGEGCSDLIYIPPAYRGGVVEFAFPFTTTGTITEDDIKLYAYDVTNSLVITPIWPGKILGAGPGKASAVFPISTTTAQIRVGLHIARAVNTGAVTVLFDDVSVSPQVGTYGMAGSDSTSYTLTIGGTTSAPTQGSGATKTATYTRIGQGLLIHFDYTQANAGSAGTGTYLFPLPSGLTATEPTASTGGTLASVGQAAIATAGTKRDAAVVLYNSTNIAIQMESAGTDPTFVGSTLAGLDVASTAYSFTAWIPAISGWSSNVSMASSSTFKISSYLASGSRVTGAAPTSLGQYRSYLRNSSAATFTETNGSPTATPTIADGIRIYNGNTYASADTNNEPTKYEIYVGKNKNVKSQWYQSAGRTGYIDPRPQGTSSTDVGYIESYDPTTGIYSVTAQFRAGSGRTSHVSGVTDDGNSSANDIYFDLIVSENALAVGVQAPRSECRFTTGNGHGGTNTKIRHFTTVTQTGTAVTCASDSTNGASATVNEDGVYEVKYSDVRAAGACTNGISINSSQLTTNIQSITATDILDVIDTPTAARGATAIFAGRIQAGGVVRFHDDSACDGTGVYTRASIVKVAN